jgi:SHS2 domain-containing protein
VVRRTEADLAGPSSEGGLTLTRRDPATTTAPEYSGLQVPPVPAPPAFETFPHDADIGVRGRGATLADALANAGRALTAVVTDPGAVDEVLSVDVACEAPDPEVLLFDWLNALVYEMATRRVLFSRFEVSVEGGRLKAKAVGEPVEVSRHHPAVEVKGATWTGLRVGREGGEWVAECVVDV